MKFAEYYQLPHITQFSSFPDLAEKLAAANFSALRASIIAHHEAWEPDLVAQWRELIDRRVPTGRTVPRSYDEALALVIQAPTVQAE